MYIVILAGGSGTRFWPVSRVARPKQLISVVDGPTMLQRTVERVLPLRPKRILVITNRLQAEETECQLAEYRRMAPLDVIAEPMGRNTAPAIGLAATLIAARDPQAVMAVLPADHFIRDEVGLRDCLQTAAQAARNGYLVTLGIVPTRPETGYGYIEADMALRGSGPFPVLRFVEKPPLEQALQYLEARNFLWNSGMFVWRADVILEELASHMPELAAQLDTLQFGGDVWDVADLEPQIEGVYSRVVSQSIDYGVMERSQRVQLVPAAIGWSDVGSWSALPEVVEADQHNNLVINCVDHIAVESHGCIVSGQGGLVATIGVNDLVVVSSGDALLVCPKDRAQDVRAVVDLLKAKGLDRYL
jgi:mannose-1-phosphate guanylyltransferase